MHCFGAFFFFVVAAAVKVLSFSIWAHTDCAAKSLVPFLFRANKLRLSTPIVQYSTTLKWRKVSSGDDRLFVCVQIAHLSGKIKLKVNFILNLDKVKWI